MKFSIVPEYLLTKRILLRDEKGVEVILCEKPNYIFKNPFHKPYLVIDNFAKKTIRVDEIRTIDIEELSKLGYTIYSAFVPKKNRWFSKQVVMYVLSKKDSPAYPSSKKLTTVPSGHKLQKDLTNNRIRIVGLNAGYPHYADQGGSSPWIEVKNDRQ